MTGGPISLDGKRRTFLRVCVSMSVDVLRLAQTDVIYFEKKRKVANSIPRPY